MLLGPGLNKAHQVFKLEVLIQLGAPFVGKTNRLLFMN
jgi:hypothetical protein